MEHRKDVNEPKPPISIIYADARQTMVSALRNVLRAYPLPLFMVEGILGDVLLEFRREAAMELSADTEAYQESLKEFYEKKQKELTDMHEQEKDELISQFESGEVVSQEEEVDCDTEETTVIGGGLNV